MSILTSTDNAASVNGITVKDINLNEVKLSDYNGKVLLIVNVASECMYTSHYKNMQGLYEQYSDKGLEILAFPCNQFGKQEPGTNEEIKNFCSTRYNVTFPIFDKIDVNGENQSPLFAMLTNNPVTGEAAVEWNFEKFIVGKNGTIVKRFKNSVVPDSNEIVTVIHNEISK